MKFACPHCSQHIEADAAWIGHSLACPLCTKTFVVSALNDVAAPSVDSSATTQSSAASESTPHPSKKESTPPTASAPPARRSSGRKWAIAASVALVVGGLAFGLLRGRASWQRVVAMLKPIPISELQAFPPEIHLEDHSDHQSVVVQGLLADGSTRDLTSLASISVTDKSIARYQDGSVSAQSDGQTTLKVRYGQKELTIPITTTQAKLERPISFHKDVMPVLMKAGCNSGACHGASRGKEGFHLSLFGYDPEGDYAALTQEIVGRRVNLATPEESLILSKATAQVPHGGGERFKPESALYRTLLDWLNAGAPKDKTNVASVVGLEIMPRQVVLEGKDAVQKLVVRALYSDGSDRDVTSLAVFFSNNETAAKIGEQGLVTSGQRGEAFVMARFATHTVGSQVIVVPLGSRVSVAEWPENNYIDHHVHAKLKKLRMTPSPLCDDATFIRRAYLDIVGSLPNSEQVREFSDGLSAGKREQLVDELLQRKEFADIWVMKFAELLQIRSVQDQFSYKAALQYYDWLRDQLLANVPIDQIVRSLITGSGSSFQHPQANYYQVQTDTLKLTENCAQVFMGMRIQCAQCHNHPFDRWTMNDYYSFAGFFARIGRKPGEDPRETIVFDRPDGEVKHPVGGRVMTPKFLGGAQPNIPEGESRRAALAKWIASPENPFFARNLANLVWAHFLGKGIIEPVDDVRVSNPASNPELLEALGTKFTEYGYDFRKLVRDICASRAYQLSTQANESNATDDRNFAHGSIRRLRAEVLLDVITQVTDTKNKFQGLPKGARAVEIADGNVNNYFLRTFGRATRGTVCSCEVRTEPNLSQALHLLNGATTQEKIAQGEVVKRQIKEGRKPDQVIEDLYVRCLARKPTAEESKKLGQFLKEGADTPTVLNDVFWALLNSKEFIFNH